MTKTLEKYMDFFFFFFFLNKNFFVKKFIKIHGFFFFVFFQKTARFLCNAYLENNDE